MTNQLEGEAPLERTGPTLLHNLIANVAGRVWAALLGLVFIPFYVRLMGIEAYGLIGVFLSAVALFSVLDMGLSPTLSRELARLSMSDSPAAAAETRNLVRTFEVLFWGTGAALGVIWIALAPVVSSHWISASGISHRTVTGTLVLMGVVMALQWPSSIYEGGLSGLQRLIRLNVVRVVMATIQNVGGLLLLWLASPSVLVYFAWLILVAFVQTATLRVALGRALPRGVAGVFEGRLLRSHARFAAGMTGITVTSIVLTQTDKIVLSRMLPLKEFGFYALASNVAMTLTLIVTPIFSALFPRFSQEFAASADVTRLTALYHRSAQTVAAFVLPAAAILVVFTDELLLLWTRDPAIVANAAPLARILAVGSALNAVMFVPYLLQIASGWTRLSVIKNLVAVAILVPWLLWGTSRFGAVAAAAAWAALNLGYLLVEVPLMHLRLLGREMWRWYRVDVALPVAMALAVAWLSRFALPPGLPPLMMATWIATTGIVALAGVALAMPATRGWILSRGTRWS